MENQFSRTKLLIGDDGIKKLNNAKVAIFGVGGVGSYVLEALTRAGVGNIIIVDNDVISESNINRQIIATHSTIGKDKVEVAKNRALDINPNVKIDAFKVLYNNENNNIIDKSVDYIIDCIDTISSKIDLVVMAKKLNIPIISSMGAGNKLDPTKFEVTDISKTSVCPLAKIMRKELRNRNIKNLKVVYSKEEPIKVSMVNEENKKVTGSISFVPSVAGLIIASEVVKDILKEEKDEKR